MELDSETRLRKRRETRLKNLAAKKADAGALSASDRKTVIRLKTDLLSNKPSLSRPLKP